MDGSVAAAGQFLPAHALHHADDLARMGVNDGDQLLDGEITRAAQLPSQGLGLGRQRLKRHIRRYDGTDRDLEIGMAERLRGLVGDKSR